jgi:ATP-dependent DNA ligase I
MATIDSSLRYFGALCDQVTAEPSTSVKQEIIAGFVSRYTGDLGLLFKLILPKFNGRLYFVQDKQLVKLFALALKVPEKTLKDDLNSSGCIGLTVKKYFHPRPSAAVNEKTGWCAMTLEDLDKHLEALSANKTEDLQLLAIEKFLNVACKNAVFLFLRQVKQDLRLGAGIRTVLSGLHSSANDIFKRCANVQEVVRRIQTGATGPSDDDDDDDGVFSFDGDEDSDGARRRSPSPAALKKGRVEAIIKIGMPLAPMLAAPSKGVEHVLAKCPNGAFSEVKYDGERVQIHKNGDSFSFWARSLKPVKPDKYEGLEKYLRAAVKANSCILDAEILMVDVETSKPLPFGTLGKHKKLQFTTAVTGLFIFDILFKDGKPLLDEPLEVRRELIKSSVDFVPNRVMISEMRHVTGTAEQRKAAMTKHLNWAIAMGLEGLVIKDVKSRYEPGARHWIKLKKDYLDGMADSADLVVLGAYYGSGNKGGVLSTFLMGVWDKTIPAGGAKQFKTVCKVGNGHDDAALAALNARYKGTVVPCVAKISPAWIDVHSSHMPDVFVRDPMKSDVWEIIGAEFSSTKTHTASGISMRFPRVLKVREDKDAATATSLQELRKLVEASKQKGHQFLPSDDDGEADEGPARAAAGGWNIPAATAPRIDLSVPSAAPAATKAFAGTPGLTHITSDIATPLIDARAADCGILICHCTCMGGRWSNRGVMGSISKFIGDEPKEAYDELSSSVKLGEVIFCEVSNRQSTGKMYVATMIGQQGPPKTGEVPQVDQPSLSKCIGKCVAFADRHGLSIHIAKLDRNTRVDWPGCEAILAAASTKTRVVVYSREGPLARTGTVASTASATLETTLPPIPTVEGFTRISAKASTGLPPILVPETLSLSSASFDDENLAFFKGVSIFIGADGLTERDRQRLGQKVAMLGGTVLSSPAGATHVVGIQQPTTVGSPVHVVTKQWIDDSFERDRRLPEAAYRPTTAPAPTHPQSSPSSGTVKADSLAGCRIVLAAFGPAEAASLGSVIAANGGVVQEAWRAGLSTHMVAAAWCPAAAKASSLGGTVVSKEWVDACVERGRPVDFTPYILDEDTVLPSPHTPPKPTGQPAVQPPPPPTVLQGIPIAFEGYSKGETQKLTELVQAMGGVVCGDARSCRYLICETLTTVSTAVADRNTVLTKAWLTACADKKKLVRTEDFKYFKEFTDDDCDAHDESPPPAQGEVARRRQALIVPSSDDDCKTETVRASSQASTANESTASDGSVPLPVANRRRSRLDDGVEANSVAELCGTLPLPILSGIVGSVFCSDDVMRCEIERCFVAYGGRLRPERGSGDPARPRSQGVVFIASSKTEAARAHEVIRRAQANTEERLAVVVAVSWLSACIKSMKLLPTLAFITSD